MAHGRLIRGRACSGLLAVLVGCGLLVQACTLETQDLPNATTSSAGVPGRGASRVDGPPRRIDNPPGVPVPDPEATPTSVLDAAAVDGGAGQAPDSSRDAAPAVSPADARTPDLAGPEALPPLPAGVDLNLGLFFYARLDDGGGNSARDEAIPPNAIALRDFNVNAAWVEGRFGTALALPGGAGGGWLRVADSLSLNTIAEGLTMGAWIFLANAEVPASGIIVARRASGEGGFWYCFQITGNRLRIRLISENVYNADHLSTIPIPRGRWVHVAVTFDLERTRLFIDGRAAGGGEYRHVIGPDVSPLTIGAGESAPNTVVERLAARLDELVIYNRPLAASEIGALSVGHRPDRR